MSHDFHARYRLLDQPPFAQAEAIDFLTGITVQPPSRQPELALIQDEAARIQLLAQAMNSPYKDQARTGSIKGKPGGLRHWMTSGRAQKFLENQRIWLERLGLWPTLPPLVSLPLHTLALHFTFILSRPYISRDDSVFHVLDNPVKKERVFQLPFVAPSQWKGALRAAIRRENGWQDDHAELHRLFGESCDDEGQAGRLYFYPTFFTRLGLEVINPHNRETGAGEQPLHFECVPAGATGDFTLLYVPGGPSAKNNGEIRSRVADDLQLVAQGIKTMLFIYGFGAKTGSGFGLAGDRLDGEGKLVIRDRLADKADPAGTQPASEPPASLPRYLESPDRLGTGFRREDGSLKPEAEYRAFLGSQGRSYGKKEKQIYEKARKWWAREGSRIAETKSGEAEPVDTPEPEEKLPVSERSFSSLSELPSLAEQVAGQLRKGGDA
jgi:CRISPR-associated protein Cmr2